MELAAFFRSVVDQDRAPVVICDLEHVIRYMNPAALRRYESRGGAALIGRSLLDCHGVRSGELIRRVVDWFAESGEHNWMYTFRNERENKDVYMAALRDEEGALIGYYEKHEYRDGETAQPYQF